MMLNPIVMFEKLLKELQIKNKSKSKEICISILLPLNQTLPDRKTNSVKIKEALHTAKALLGAQAGHVHNLQFFIDELDLIPKRIDLKKNHRALGIFLGRGINELVYFPFPVEEKVIVDNSFETRDLVYATQYLIPYRVLVVSTKNVRLLSGEFDQLTEVVDDNFPISYAQQYQYPEARSGDYLDEETKIKEVRKVQYFRHVNKIADKYLKNDATPIILAGVKDVLELFETTFDHMDRVAVRMHGNFNYLSAGQIAHLASTKMDEHLKQANEKLIDEIDESLGKHGYIYGMAAVWRTAVEGRADLLVVEKDFKVPAYVDPETSKVFFNISDPEGLTERMDAVDDLIELVLDKKGRVVFLQNGALDQYDHIAARTRY